MDPSIQSLLIGLITNGLSSVLASGFKASGKAITGKELADKIEWDKVAIRSTLERATADAADVIQDMGTPTTEVAILFLSSDVALSLIEALYTLQVSDEIALGDAGSKLSSTRKQFRTALASFVKDYSDVDHIALNAAADEMFNVLLHCSALALTAAADKGQLSALNAMSNLRHELMVDILLRHSENVERSLGIKQPSPEEILKFERQYRTQLRIKHGRITSSYLDAPEPRPIQDLYVAPLLLPAGPQDIVFESQSAKVTLKYSRASQEKGSTLSELLANLKRAVVLGDPGGGKSTMAAKICYDLAVQFDKRLCANRELTPILVVLREYADQKRKSNVSITQFIEMNLRLRYQIDDLPPHIVEHMLSHNRVMVIFDGLDELLDMRYRQEVRDDIECFCNIHPHTPALVTSRKVGYDQSPLDIVTFQVLYLAPFTDNQVKEYVTKWFKADRRLSVPDQQKKIIAFMNESRTVQDIRSNPLMLSLMCNLFRGENFIPQNRPQLYSKCATVLFETWDKSRGIEVPFSYEERFAPTIEFLAYNIYTNPELQGGVTEERLTDLATTFLSPSPIENYEKARNIAHSFVTFCRTRAWVLTATGSSRQGEELYEFTHRTFLEYFAAAYLVSIKPTPGTLGRTLLPRIARGEWDVVSQIAFQLLGRRVRITTGRLNSGADKLVADLVVRAEKSKPVERLNLLSFGVRCLSFLVIDPDVIRRLITSSINACIANARPLLEKTGERGFIWETLMDADPQAEAEHSDAIQSIVWGIPMVAADNSETVLECVRQTISHMLNGDDAVQSQLALEMLVLVLDSRMLRPVEQDFTDRTDTWQEMADEIWEENRARIVALAEKGFGVSLNALQRGFISLAQVIRWHGLLSVFEDLGYAIIPTTGRTSVADQLLAFSLRPAIYDVESDRAHLLSLLDDLGDHLQECSPPWLRAPVTRISLGISEFWFRSNINNSNNTSDPPVSLSPRALFAAFTLAAIALEKAELTQHENTRTSVATNLDLIESHDNPLQQYLRWTLMSRFRDVNPNHVEFEINSAPLSEHLKALLQGWTRRKVSFLDHTDSPGLHGIPDPVSGIYE